MKSSAARYKLTINVGKDAEFNVESGSSVTAENITNNGKVKVDGATLNLAGTVTNNKEMFISGASVINGGYDENGEIDPYKITFIYKTGFRNEVGNAKQRFGKKASRKRETDLCCNTTHEVNTLCSDSSIDTCGDGCSFVPTKSRYTYRHKT